MHNLNLYNWVAVLNDISKHPKNKKVDNIDYDCLEQIF